MSYRWNPDTATEPEEPRADWLPPNPTEPSLRERVHALVEPLPEAQRKPRRPNPQVVWLGEGPWSAQLPVAEMCAWLTSVEREEDEDAAAAAAEEKP